MAKCHLCGAEVDEVTECKDCGRDFCENCGDKSARLCNECKESDIEFRRAEESDIIDDLQDEVQEQVEEEGD